MVFLKKLCLYAIVVLALQIFCSCEPYIGNLFNNTNGVSSRASSITDYTVDFGASYSVLLVSDVHFESVYEEPTKLLSFIESLSVKPVACFVLGDITRNCRESEFNAYLSFCDDIKAAGIQYIYSIPGNHDCDDGGTLYLSK
nr:metallophosphoesterase [Treponema sp.]